MEKKDKILFVIPAYNNKFSFNDYISLRIFTSIISLLLLLSFSLISDFNTYKVLVIMFIMLFRSVEAISDCYYGMEQKNEHLYDAGISLSIKAILGLLVFIIIDYLTKNLLLAILGIVIVNLLLFVIYDMNKSRIFINNKIKFTNKNFKKILIVTFPIFVFSFLSIYLTNCQKYVLTYFVSDELQTIFGILIMPATVLSLAGSYIIMPFVNKLTLLFNTKKINDFNKLVSKLLLALIIIGLLALVVCWFLGIPVLSIIYSTNLNNYKISLLLIIIASIFWGVSLVLSNILTVMGINKSQTIIYLISCIVSTIDSIVLIPRLSINGAVYSYLTSMIICAILYIILYYYNLNKIKYYC